MPRKSTSTSKRKSEAEEADGYATPRGRQQTQREFARALRTGTLSRSPGLKAAGTDPKRLEQLMKKAKKNAARAVSVRKGPANRGKELQPRYTLDELLAQCDPKAARTKKEREWTCNMPESAELI
jgi:hypothetical protein